METNVVTFYPDFISNL